jgi:signal transduction histidine kinase
MKKMVNEKIENMKMIAFHYKGISRMYKNFNIRLIKELDNYTNKIPKSDYNGLLKQLDDIIPHMSGSVVSDEFYENLFMMNVYALTKLNVIVEDDLNGVNASFNSGGIYICYDNLFI